MPQPLSLGHSFCLLPRNSLILRLSEQRKGEGKKKEEGFVVVRGSHAQTNLVITRETHKWDIEPPGQLVLRKPRGPTGTLTDVVFFSISSLITLILYFC